MKKFLSLLALLCVTTMFSYSSFHSSYHSSYHPSYHSTPHSTYHSTSTSHSSYHSTPSVSKYRPISVVEPSHIIYHPIRGYYYYLLLNNHTHTNDTIKANTAEEVKEKVVSESKGEDGDATLLILIAAFIGAVFVVVLLAGLTD